MSINGVQRIAGGTVGRSSPFWLFRVCPRTMLVGGPPPATADAERSAEEDLQ